MVRVLDASGMTFEIITVSDGSTDGSPFTLDELPRERGAAHLVRHERGQGPRAPGGARDGAGAVSRLHRRRRRHLPRVPGPLRLHHATRRSPTSSSGASGTRTPRCTTRPCGGCYSWGYQRLIHLLFRLNVKDTQVGIKLVDRRVIADVLPLLRESRFALDLELLVLARRLGYTRIVEAPVADPGAVREHDLAQGGVAAPGRHAGTLRPLLHPARVRRGDRATNGAERPSRGAPS